MRSGAARSAARGKAAARVAAGGRHRRLEEAHEYALHEVVLVAHHEEQRLAAADRKAIVGLSRGPNASSGVHENGGALLKPSAAETPRNHVRGKLRRHRAQGMAGRPDARAVDAPGEQAAQFAGGGRRARRRQGRGGSYPPPRPDGAPCG